MRGCLSGAKRLLIWVLTMLTLPLIPHDYVPPYPIPEIPSPKLRKTQSCESLQGFLSFGLKDRGIKACALIPNLQPQALSFKPSALRFRPRSLNSPPQILSPKPHSPSFKPPTPLSFSPKALTLHTVKTLKPMPYV